MCGISGFLVKGLTENAWEEALTRMGRALLHRGPDAGAIWFDAEVGIGLSHRRLSIVDLSPLGSQPMVSATGRYCIVFNGEVYNFPALRDELSVLGHRFRGRSDTEVMLAAFESWGIEPALKRFVGMFAFGLWDREERRLYLGRDRLGEKPLYYGWSGNTFLFGSELKALKAHPAWRGDINRDAITLLMRHNCIPAPYSIYHGINKLSPGTLLSVRLGEPTGNPVPYWSAKDVAEAGKLSPFSGTVNEGVDQLESLLRDSIRQQILADVPLGAFLSGGVDSSTVVAIMQSLSNRPIKTFTIGFQDEQYNEAVQAKAVAKHLETDHTELYLMPHEALGVIPRLPSLYDEPFSDSSQIPTFLLSQLAKQHVTVSLSGDAGDELFGGYNRYIHGSQVWRNAQVIPHSVREVIAPALRTIPSESWDRAFDTLSRLLPIQFKQRFPGEKLYKLADLLTVDSIEALYKRLVSHWPNPSELVIGSTEPSTVLSNPEQWAKLPNSAEQMMFLDLVTYLPDDILVKVDRAAMGVSLETRVPFLDHRVVEFAWQLPTEMKIREGQGKWLLRQLLYRHVPRELIDRPKTGFAIPLAEWLRGPLREWAEDLLSAHRLGDEGYFNSVQIRIKWEEHLTGKRNWQYELWDVLMFQAWLQEQKPSRLYV